MTRLRDIGTASLNVLHDEAAHTHTRIFLLHQKLIATSSSNCILHDGKEGKEDLHMERKRTQQTEGRKEEEEEDDPSTTRSCELRGHKWDMH